MKDFDENIKYSSENVAVNLEQIPIATVYRNKAILKLERILKRTIDIIAGIFGIITLLPLTLIVYIANLVCKDSGPVFYTQERYGKNGKIFKLYKYRSMVVGADEKLERYLAENEEARREYREYKKLKNDPRITKIGNILRKTSLDEFPQFINILKGDMSLVGPRPYLPREREEINGFFNYIMSVKPGLTGLWQVNGRSDTTFTERLTLDMSYYYKHNLKMDLKILGKTVKNVVKKEGAI